MTRLLNHAENSHCHERHVSLKLVVFVKLLFSHGTLGIVTKLRSGTLKTRPDICRIVRG